ncbi:MAG: YitT family protein [Clostridia bacterium]
MTNGKERPLLSWLQILLGLVIASLSYCLFLVPNDIAAGGFTGIGQLINAFTGWPIGTVAFALNVPLFAFSMKALGLKFGLKSLFAAFMLSLLIDLLPSRAMTTEPILAAVYGGVFSGVGFGLIMRGGATTGGSEMLAKLVSGRVPVLSVGAVTFAVDALVIVVSGIVFDAAKALLALIAIFLMNHMLDMMLEGFNTAKCYTVISNAGEKIAQRVLTELDRGVTGLRGVGMYSGDERLVLLCVVSRLEAMQLRRIVIQEDPRAFIIATDVREALGEGFKEHPAQVASPAKKQNQA